MMMMLIDDDYNGDDDKNQTMMLMMMITYPATFVFMEHDHCVNFEIIQKSPDIIDGAWKGPLGCYKTVV